MSVRQSRPSIVTVLAVAIAVAATVALAAPPAEAVIVNPTLAGSSNLNPLSTADKLTDNSGLSAAVNTGDPLGFAQAVTHVYNGGFIESWVTNDGTSDYFSNGFGATNPPMFVWDLGQDFAVNDAVLWQYQNNGGNGTNIGNHTRTIDVQFNTSAEGAVSFSGPATTITMQSVLGLGGTNSAQTLPLGDETARYVKMTITDNYVGQPGITGGGDRVGLGEVRFNVSTPVPEPMTAGLALFGLSAVGVALRRRRA
jgi:PEP-CTERM motif